VTSARHAGSLSTISRAHAFGGHAVVPGTPCSDAWVMYLAAAVNSRLRALPRYPSTRGCTPGPSRFSSSDQTPLWRENGHPVQHGGRGNECDGGDRPSPTRSRHRLRRERRT